MDHAQLTTADYAQIDTERARREVRELSLKLDGLADLLGRSPEEFLRKGQELEAKRIQKKKEEAEEAKRIEEEEFKASGLTREEWGNKRWMESIIRGAKLCDGIDTAESMSLKNYVFSTNVDMGILGLTK